MAQIEPVGQKNSDPPKSGEGKRNNGFEEPKDRWCKMEDPADCYTTIL